MANFPRPNGNGYDNGNFASNHNGPYISVNGRRKPIGPGIYGSEINAVARAGRRMTRVRDGYATMVNSGKFYTPDELIGKNGKPVKFVEIPDRTKGAPAGMESVLVFLDQANIQANAPCRHIDQDNLLNYIGEDRYIQEAYAYVPIDPRRPDGKDFLIRGLQNAGWQVSRKMGKIAGESYKANVDIEMCIDIMRCAQQIRPDIVVLCSGDGDFVPVVKELRRMGIRVEVASFEIAADNELQREASGFISLDVWLRDIAESLADELEAEQFSENAPDNNFSPEPVQEQEERAE